VSMRIVPRLAVALCLAGFCFANVHACQYHDSTTAYKDLGITAEQKAKVEAMRLELKAFRESQDVSIEAVNKKIDAEVKKVKPDQTALNTLTKELNGLRQKVSDKRVGYLLQIKKLLNADQFGKLVDSDWGCRCMTAGEAKADK
jgi:Spy/CpxP family protein refolding chaperone